jgi:hypothetical protein
VELVQLLFLCENTERLMFKSLNREISYFEAHHALQSFLKWLSMQLGFC